MAPRITASPSISIDGYMAGPDQDESNPLGVGGGQLHEWIFATKWGREMIGETGGSEGIDFSVGNDFVNGAGATIMGRNMFGPERGTWGDSDWRGWWGDDPPFHHPVFVLTHFERPDLLVGDTTFHFVNGGVDSVVSMARAAAPDGDIHVGGGAATLKSFLNAQLVDVLRVAVVPIYLGMGERLFEVAGEWPEGYEVRDIIAGEGATHYTLVRTSPTSS
ncbi:MAG TPA: dihydrofolate reductase family protein [Acidimicrobiales bacterium]